LHRPLTACKNINKMVKKVYCLSTCSTCSRILKDFALERKGFALQDIKTQPVSPAELEQLKALAGSYEALFSRRALKYKELGLKDRSLTDHDYKKLILEEYTFLKRPVVVLGKKIFVGSEKKNLELLGQALASIS